MPNYDIRSLLNCQFLAPDSFTDLRFGISKATNTHLHQTNDSLTVACVSKWSVGATYQPDLHTLKSSRQVTETIVA